MEISFQQINVLRNGPATASHIRNFDRSSLFIFFASIIDKIKNKSQSRQLHAESSTHNIPDQIMVVLADDDGDDRELFGEVITEINSTIKVEVVADGVQLMDLLNRLTILPDVIFLDLNMPGKNGKQCLMEIKNDSRLRDLPVIIYSTSALNTDIKETHSIGANFYIRKSNSFKGAVSQMKKVFSLDLDNLKPHQPMINFVLSAETL